MTKKRDTVTYELKQGNTVVYVGTTNDPERREQEHDEGKQFSHMNIFKAYDRRRSQAERE